MPVDSRVFFVLYSHIMSAAKRMRELGIDGKELETPAALEVELRRVDESEPRPGAEA